MANPDSTSSTRNRQPARDTARSLLLLLLLVGLSYQPAWGEYEWREGLASNLRWSLDTSSRPLYYADEDRFGSIHAVGIDLHKVFTSERRNIATVTAQAYLTRIDDVRNAPAFFEDEDDTELVYRIFNVNLHTPSDWLPDVRIGHMELPYGLEQLLDTNGTLRQYSPGRNLGIKADWGISLNKQHAGFEYEVSATTGGNQSLQRQDGSYAYAGRVGSNRDANIVIGGSGYRSFLNGVRRERVGLDAQFHWGRQTLFTELNAGRDDGQNVINTLLEWNTRNRRETLSCYTQLFYNALDSTNLGAEETLSANFGVSYLPNSHLDLSAQYDHVLKNPGDTNPSTLSVQMRYRF